MRSPSARTTFASSLRVAEGASRALANLGEVGRAERGRKSGWDEIAMATCFLALLEQVLRPTCKLDTWGFGRTWQRERAGECAS